MLQMVVSIYRFFLLWMVLFSVKCSCTEDCTMLITICNRITYYRWCHSSYNWSPTLFEHKIFFLIKIILPKTELGYEIFWTYLKLVGSKSSQTKNFGHIGSILGLRGLTWTFMDPQIYPKRDPAR